MADGFEMLLTRVVDDLRFEGEADLLARIDARIDADLHAGDAPLAAPLRAPRQRRARRAWPALLAAAIVLVASLVAVPSVRTAVARWFGIGGVDIELGTTPSTTGPLPSLPAPGADIPGLGAAVTVEEAQDRTRLTAPVLPSLGEPDAVYATDAPAGGQIVEAWRPGGGLPPSPDGDVGALLSVFRGETGIALYRKAVDPAATDVEEVRVGDVDGVFLSGGRHVVAFVDRDDQWVQETARVAGNTLLWTDGHLTYRLESALDRDAAIALAETMR